MANPETKLKTTSLERMNAEVNVLMDYQKHKPIVLSKKQQREMKEYVAPPEDMKTDFSEDENKERGNWSGKLDFILACLGFAVGLGNVWRFPYLCYKHGGGIFLIPYAIMLCFVGIPLFFLELALGQFTSSGPLTCWKFAPIFTGLGVGMLIVSSLIAIYYNMIIGWAIYYLAASFSALPGLPWAGEVGCNNDWNTPYCQFNLHTINETSCLSQGLTLNTTNGICMNGTQVYGIYDKDLAANQSIKPVSPAQEYLNRAVWRKHESSGIEDLGSLHWDLALCLLCAWVLTAFCLIKGVKSSGKVVYFTATFPYVVLIILFVRGLLLPGSEDGIDYYLGRANGTNWTKLEEAEVWKDAAVQIFFSLGNSYGGLIALASYNRFHNNCLRDTLIVSIGNCLTSFFAGFVIFSYLGYLAHELGESVDVVADSAGVGLAFIVYPRAVATIDLSPLWAILFFIMLITLGLDSEFAFVETITTSVMDVFKINRGKFWLVVAIISVIGYLLGLIMCTSGGAYMLQLMDDFSAGWNVLLIAFFECAAVGWVYGFRRFREDIRTMIGNYPCCCMPWSATSWWWAITWCFVSPLIIAFIIFFNLLSYAPPRFDDYLYPDWGVALGWLMTLTVIIGMVVPIFYYCIMTKGGCCDRVFSVWSPTDDWGPALVHHRRLIARYIPDFIVDPRNQLIKEHLYEAPPDFPDWSSDRSGVDNPAFGSDPSDHY